MQFSPSRYCLASLVFIMVSAASLALAQGTEKAEVLSQQNTLQTQQAEAPVDQAIGGAGATDQVEAWIKQNMADVESPLVEPPADQTATTLDVVKQPSDVPDVFTQPGGSLDWGTGEMAYTTEEIIPADALSPVRDRAMGLRRATLRARKALLEAVEDLPLDGRRTVKTTLTPPELSAVRAHLQNSFMRQREETGEDGSMRLVVSSQTTLRGDLADLLMPSGDPFLGGVPETIELTISSVPAPVRDPEKAAYRKSMADLGGFTGLVVDARGLGGRPALLPVVADPSGLTAYGPFQVARDDAGHHGLAIFTTNPNGNMLRTRVGKSPLVVRALAVSGANSADFVVSYEDAMLVRSLFRNQDVKNFCRAVIILD